MKNEILSSICSELVKVMGPLAPAVMADKITSLGMAEGDFPMERIARLVEVLSFEIHDGASRAEFQKGALNQIKHFEAHSGV